MRCGGVRGIRLIGNGRKGSPLPAFGIKERCYLKRCYLFAPITETHRDHFEVNCPDSGRNSPFQFFLQKYSYQLEMR